MKFACAIEMDSAFVERPHPDAAPSAFRIWRAGRIEADGGRDDESDTVWFEFSELSAKLLIEEQDRRGRTYPFDFDHLSLRPDREPTAGRAAGYHRLEVRRDENGAAELWAIDIEWSPDVKLGLEEKPPRWRYYSPAFSFDQETREIISYTNCAICINPRTHNLQALACLSNTNQGRDVMSIEEMLALIDSLLASAAEGPEKEKLLAMKASLEKMKEGDGGDGNPTDEEAAKEAAAAAAAAKTAADPEDDKDKKTETTATSILAELSKRTSVLEMASVFASRPDINPKLRAELSALPVEKARKIVATMSMPTPPLKTSATVGGDANKHQKTPEQLALDERADRALGVHRSAAPETLGFASERGPEGRYVLATMTPTEARAHAAAKAAKAANKGGN